MSSMWLVFVIVAPMVAGVLNALSRKRFFGIIGSCLSLFVLGNIWWEHAALEFSVPIVLPGLGVSYGVGPIPLLLATVTTVVWLASSVFALRYMSHEHDNPRFYLLFGLAYGGATACFFSQDFLAFLLAFEMMSLASAGLVAHSRTREAHAAGKLYLFLGVSSGILIAIAAALLWHHAGTLTYAKLHEIPLPIAVLFSLGFAIKAGAYPMHFWLPEAHPVAPSPASAVLSGILIKTGAFGMLQIASVTAESNRYGLWLIIVALITMSLGVFLALVQHGAKRMLAYHSVSQMGYILLGIGLWALERNALGMAGAVFHIINHALFKSALFLIAGSALLAAGTVDLYRLGFMRKVFGLFTPLALIPALGIAGVPGFNGFVSKTLLHDALLHAETASSLLVIAEKVFVLVAFGTVCSFIKFSWYLFFAERNHTGSLPRVSVPEVLGIGILAACSLVIGLFPQPIVETLAKAAHELHAHWPEHLDLFSSHALQSGATVLIGGLVLFLVGLRTGLFHLHLPQRLSIISGGSCLGRIGSRAYGLLANSLASVRGVMVGWEVRELRVIKRSLQALDYRPSSSPALHGLSVTNLNFDLYVVMAVLSVLIVGYPLVIR